MEISPTINGDLDGYLVTSNGNREMGGSINGGAPAGAVSKKTGFFGAPTKRNKKNRSETYGSIDESMGLSQQSLRILLGNLLGWSKTWKEHTFDSLQDGQSPAMIFFEFWGFPWIFPENSPAMNLGSDQQWLGSRNVTLPDVDLGMGESSTIKKRHRNECPIGPEWTSSSIRGSENL